MNENDIGEDRSALHVDSRSSAADHINARHARCRYPLQNVIERIRLGRWALAIDQDIPRRSGEAANALAGIEGEPWQPRNHVESRIGLRRGKKCCGIGAST